MVVHVAGENGLELLRMEEKVFQWIQSHPIAAARLILQLMPEGHWGDEQEFLDD